jgi:hypothetical protein
MGRSPVEVTLDSSMELIRRQTLEKAATDLRRAADAMDDLSWPVMSRTRGETLRSPEPGWEWSIRSVGRPARVESRSGYLTNAGRQDACLRRKTENPDVGRWILGSAALDEAALFPPGAGSMP